MSFVRVGVAGPVGSGKTALIEALTRRLSDDYSIGVVTNDIYTKEDAEFLAKNSVLPLDRSRVRRLAVLDHGARRLDRHAAPSALGRAYASARAARQSGYRAKAST